MRIAAARLECADLDCGIFAGKFENFVVIVAVVRAAADALADVVAVEGPSSGCKLAGQDEDFEKAIQWSVWIGCRFGSAYSEGAHGHGCFQQPWAFHMAPSFCIAQRIQLTLE